MVVPRYINRRSRRQYRTKRFRQFCRHLAGEFKIGPADDCTVFKEGIFVFTPPDHIVADNSPFIDHFIRPDDDVVFKGDMIVDLALFGQYHPMLCLELFTDAGMTADNRTIDTGTVLDLHIFPDDTVTDIAVVVDKNMITDNDIIKLHVFPDSDPLSDDNLAADGDGFKIDILPGVQ